MNELAVLNEEKIENMIYEIRGQQVMLDSDLAKLYGVETKRINEAVRNNPLKFPERFAWTLTKDEVVVCSRSKFSTLNENTIKRGHNIKYLPRVFTEQGVAMLATILKSPIATEVSIRIMDAFVEMRHYLISNKDIYKSLNNINNKLVEHDEKINYIFSKFDEKIKVNEIYFDGQIYDAYSKMVDIMMEAKTKLVIVDGYADKSVLDMIAKVSVPVTLIVKKKSLLTALDIEKYNKQYANLTIKKDDSFHDRYIIIDDKVIHHCGASLNHVGNRIFCINLLVDDVVIESLLSKIKEIMKT